MVPQGYQTEFKEDFSPSTGRSTFQLLRVHNLLVQGKSAGQGRAAVPRAGRARALPQHTTEEELEPAPEACSTASCG
jgi:hypothetical protein